MGKQFMKIAKAVLFRATIMVLQGCNVAGIKPDSEQSVEPVAANTAEATIIDDTATAEDWFQKGNELLEQNQSLMAIEAYHRALQLDKSHTRAWHNLGLIYLQRASIAFENLVKQSKEDDVLKQRAEYVVNAMEQILQKGFSEH